jgi:hypothetical protein
MDEIGEARIAREGHGRVVSTKSELPSAAPLRKLLGQLPSRRLGNVFGSIAHRRFLVFMGVEARLLPLFMEIDLSDAFYRERVSALAAAID